VTEEDIHAFVRASIGSVYALELLLLLQRRRDEALPAAELVRELRSSPTAVNEALSRLMAAGLVSEKPAGHYVYAPASAEREQMVAAVDRTYAVKPMTLVKAIMSAPNEKLRMFSDAFKLKE
jgi:DNA-binding GntR family transcriptional regulator